ncbi:MAG: 4-(cytidine 5'-diphospho)-2-C-methyl-D-erythritol kinase [Dehalococcoidia bacterium]
MSFTLSAPAKVNLVLEVLGERPDGYHEVATVLQAVGLEDTLSFSEAADIVVEGEVSDFDVSDSSVAHAARALQRASGCQRGARIRLKKAIPVAAGLGGGSSDAAATLVGLDRLWGLGWGRERLVGLATGLGSDTPFFLYGGTALGRGRGEQVTPLPPFREQWLVILHPPLPPVPSKTQQLYQSLSRTVFTSGELCQRLCRQMESGGEMEPDLLFNVFESIAFDFFPGLDGWAGRLLSAGAGSAHLAGSGPALYSLVRDKAGGQIICDKLAQEGVEAFLVANLPPLR